MQTTSWGRVSWCISSWISLPRGQLFVLSSFGNGSEDEPMEEDDEDSDEDDEDGEAPHDDDEGIVRTRGA